MQESSAFLQPPLPEQERLKCPRCESTNTKFCYYNNYNLSQPRHFCKHCRRYWTKGGSLRNIPVGGGTRKAATKRPKQDQGSSQARRSSPGSAEPSPGLSQPTPPVPSPTQIVGPGSGVLLGLGIDPERRLLDAGNSFSSLLASNYRFGTVLEHPNSSEPKVMRFHDLGENLNSATGLSPGIGRSPEQGGPKPRGNGELDGDYLSLHNTNGDRNGGEEAGCVGNSRGWPDLAIFTPSSRFQ